MEIYNKYRIEHVDGTPLKGKRYFVLRLDSDDPVEAAKVDKAMRAYKGELRNCDIGTAEEQEERFTKFCLEDRPCAAGGGVFCAFECPLNTIENCRLKWAQMPYEAPVEKDETR